MFERDSNICSRVSCAGDSTQQMWCGGRDVVVTPLLWGTWSWSITRPRPALLLLLHSTSLQSALSDITDTSDTAIQLGQLSNKSICIYQ